MDWNRIMADTNEECTQEPICDPELRIEVEAPEPGGIGEYCILPADGKPGSLEVRNNVGSWTKAKQNVSGQGTLRVHPDRLTFMAESEMDADSSIEPFTIGYSLNGEDAGDPTIEKTLFITKA